MSESAKSYTSEDFFRLLARSGLLNETLFEEQKARYHDGTATPKAIVAKMLSEHLLTPFQAKQLSEGRHRGFFLSEKYKILDFLGQGGMSRVLLCEHMLLQRLVAVKILNKSLDKFPGASERFMREARASAAMDHPNIARVFDVDRTGIGPCIVMEYVDGTNLHELAVRHELLAVNRVANYISQAAVGLHQAHRAGLVHRDIKPANLMLDRSGRVKLLDLGLARFFDPQRSDNLTQQIDASCIIGTADYIAPEQVMDSSSADIRSDIYSLGYTMYFLLTRKVPAGDGPVMRKLVWHQTKDPEPIRNVRPEVPPELAEVLDRMIRKTPGERFQTPADVVAALSPWTAERIAPPADFEMPKVRASSYRLGLCPPPDSSKFVGSPAPGGSAKDSASDSSSAVRQSGNGSDSGSKPGSGSVVGLSTPLGSAEVMPTGSTIRSTKTSDGLTASAETIAASSSSFNRNVELLTEAEHRAAFLRRHRLTGVLLAVTGVMLMVLAFMVGGLISQYQLIRHYESIYSQNSIPLKKPPVPSNSPLQLGNEVAPTTEQAVPPVGVVLRGGGSTFVRPAMELWARTFEAESGIKIEYSAVGSSKGVEGLLSHFLDFSCTDSALTAEQQAEAGAQVLHIPLAFGAVVPTYNLGNRDGETIPIRFTGAVLANIYLGKIKNWNDPAIVVSNPSCDLPDLPITVVCRKDGSGTTAIWTDFLSKSSSTWKHQIGSANKINWPVGTAVEKNDGVANEVSRTIGAIGYVELSYATANGLSVGHVKNQMGAFVEPSINSIAAATAALHEIPDDLKISLTDMPGPNAYPIVGTCWAVLRVNEASDRGNDIVRFLRWATTQGQPLLPGIQYGRLPKEITDRINATLDKVSFHQ